MFKGEFFLMEPRLLYTIAIINMRKPFGEAEYFIVQLAFHYSIPFVAEFYIVAGRYINNVIKLLALGRMRVYRITITNSYAYIYNIHSRSKKKTLYSIRNIYESG